MCSRAVLQWDSDGTTGAAAHSYCKQDHVSQTVPDHLHSGRSQQLSISAMHLLVLGQRRTDSESEQCKIQRQLIFPSVHCSRLLVAVCLREWVGTVQVCTYASATVHPVLTMWAVFVLCDVSFWLKTQRSQHNSLWIPGAAEETQTSPKPERHPTLSLHNLKVNLAL